MYSKIVTFNHAAVGNQGLIFSFKIQQKNVLCTLDTKSKKIEENKNRKNWEKKIGKI